VISIERTDLGRAGLDRVARLMARVFPRSPHLDAGYLDWCYNENPVGSAIAFDISIRGRLVGHIAGLPVRVRVLGDDDLGLIPINNAALMGRGSKPRSGRRGKSITVTLMDKMAAAGRDAGFGCIIGVTNDYSTPMAHRLDGAQLLGPLDVRVGFGPALPGSADAGREFEVVWDAEPLAWRLRRPGARYRVRSRAGRSTVYALPKTPGFAVELGRFDHRQVADLRRLPQSRPGRVWIGRNRTRRWWRRPMVPLPPRLRRSPLNFVFIDITGRGRRVDYEHVRVNAIDLDLY
jgi:hypothetical protein